MTSTKAIATGLAAAARTKWMVLIFFACNLLLAAAIAAPMHQAIASHLGNSMMGKELVEGLSSAWLNEFQIANKGFLEGFSTAIVYGAILFLALNTILSAGAFEVYAQKNGAGVDAFGRGMGKYLARFVRLAIIASVFYFAVFWFWNGPVARGLGLAFRDSVKEGLPFYLEWVRLALFFFCVFVVNAIVEYAKADLVLDEHSSVLGALGHAAGFVFAKFGRVMFIYIGIGLLTLAAVILYAVFARYFPQHSVATIFLWFVVAQGLIFFRWMFRLSSWAATVAFYDAHRVKMGPEPSVVAAPA